MIEQKLTIREFVHASVGSLETLQEEILAQLVTKLNEALPSQQQAYDEALRTLGQTLSERDQDEDSPMDGPPRKWKFTEDQKEHIWLVVVLGDAITEMHNDQLLLEKFEPISEIMSRKTLYRKVRPIYFFLSSFPILQPLLPTHFPLLTCIPGILVSVSRSSSYWLTEVLTLIYGLFEVDREPVA